MTAKTMHKDEHCDSMSIYRASITSSVIFIDGLFDGNIAWRGIYRAKEAREIAKRLNDLADLIDIES